MSARIIPFGRPVAKESATARPNVPPPLARHVAIDGCIGNAIFYGTREQLIAWKVAAADLFPIAPKRRAYGGGLPGGGSTSLKAVRGGIYEAHLHASPSCEPEAAARITRLATSIIAEADQNLRVSSELLTLLHRWYCGAVDRPRDQYDAFERVIVETTLRRQPNALRPPDETEPEHAQ